MLKKTNTRKSFSLTKKHSIAIVAACYNPTLTEALLRSTLNYLTKNGNASVQVFRVPGAYEIPLLVQTLARSKKIHAVIALGIVLQGKTSHASHIGLSCTLSLQQIALQTGIPIIHQILTPKNIQDAKKRVRIRGEEAAQVAIEMTRILETLF